MSRATREAYRDSLLPLLNRHPELMCLDSDTGLFNAEYAAAAGDQYLNLGIAEHNLMGVAAGMAATGRVPFVNTMAAFATSRALEAIKIDIAYNRLPVRIMATHGGLAAGHLGPTHQALEDLAVMRVLPSMTVVVPADAAAAEAFVEQSLNLPGPLYVRLGRKPTPALPAAPPPVIGQAQTLRQGGDVVLASCGPYPVLACLEAAEVLAGHGIEATVLNVHTLRPFDTRTLVAAARPASLVVTLEEHWRGGGLGGAVAETLAEAAPTRVLRLGMPNQFVDEVGNQEHLVHHYGLTADRVVQTVRTALDTAAAAGPARSLEPPKETSAMDTKSSHVVHVGFAEQHIDSIEFGEHQVSLLVHRHVAEHMSDAARQRFARIGVLDVPHSLDFDDYDRALDQMIGLVEEFTAELGPPTAVVAMYEHVTLPAARLRDHFGVPGVDTETAQLCRDKVRMKEAMRSGGVRIPAFWAVDAATPYADLEKIAAAVPGRLVLKPQRQAGSFGILVFRDGAEFLAHARTHGILDDHEVEEFIEGDVCHVDGVVRDGEIRFISASRYIGDCLGFQNGEQHLSGVTFDDASMLTRITDFTALVLKSLNLHTSTFHLELFHTPDNELVFLEIGNRFGGAYISDSLRAVYGVDLVRESVLACMNLPSEVTAVSSILDHADVGACGWLYTALPVSEPCTVRRIRGLDTCPDSVVLSAVPHIGQTLNDDITVFPSAGKFALAGASSAQVEQDIRRLAASYAVETSPRRISHI